MVVIYYILVEVSMAAQECALSVCMYITCTSYLQPSIRFIVCRCRLVGASWWVHPHGQNPPLGGPGQSLCPLIGLSQRRSLSRFVLWRAIRNIYRGGDQDIPPLCMSNVWNIGKVHVLHDCRWTRVGTYSHIQHTVLHSTTQSLTLLKNLYECLAMVPFN